MRSMRGKTVFGGGMIAIAVAMSITGCAARAEEADVVPVDITDELTPTGKPVKSPGPTMNCVQATTGCTPVGYRTAYCEMANLKPNSYVLTCVKAKCPAVYGYDNGRGESCFPAQKVALDGTAVAFLPLQPDATYSMTTYTSKNGVPDEVLASTNVSIASSVGQDTQCGGVPSGSCL